MSGGALIAVLLVLVALLAADINKATRRERTAHFRICGYDRREKCECGKLTRGDCSKKYGPDCVLQLPTGNSAPSDDIGPYPK